MTNENPFSKMPFGYFNALLASVVGSDEQRDLAKQYLKEVDPEIWDE